MKSFVSLTPPRPRISKRPVGAFSAFAAILNEGNLRAALIRGSPGIAGVFGHSPTRGIVAVDDCDSIARARRRCWAYAWRRRHAPAGVWECQVSGRANRPALSQRLSRTHSRNVSAGGVEAERHDENETDLTREKVGLTPVLGSGATAAAATQDFGYFSFLNRDIPLGSPVVFLSLGVRAPCHHRPVLKRYRHGPRRRPDLGNNTNANGRRRR